MSQHTVNGKSATANTPYKHSRALLICSLAALFYLYEFLIRVMPSAIAHDIMYSFNIQATSLGFLSALFFYGYVPLQIPAGLLFDRFGARNILTIMTLLCALACVGFALTTSFGVALSMRFIMGLTGAFAFTGAAFTATHWISSRYFAMYTGFIQTLGCIGAIAGQAPIAHLNHLNGWRQTNIYIALVGVLFTILIFAIVRDRPHHDTSNSPATAPKLSDTKIADKHLSHRTRLAKVLHNRQNWWIGSFAGLSWASINLFASLWGIPYLMQYYHISPTAAGSLLISCWLGIAIGSPAIGLWSKRCKTRLTAMLTCIICGLLSSLLIIFDHQLSIPVMIATLFIFGLSASGQPISFDLVYDNNPRSTIGTAIGFNNMCVIAGGLIMQPLAGYILQASSHAHHLTQNHYTLESYQLALLLMPACFILNAGISIWGIKKSLRQHKRSVD